MLVNKGIHLGIGGVELSNHSGFSLINSFFNRYTKKILAFTLAETLIVMGVIGIVAALTIPNLNSSTNNQEKVTKVKKIYAELNEAQNRATAVYGPLETWFVNDTTSLAMRQRYINRITEFMKVTKSCINSADGCMPTSTKKVMSDVSGFPVQSYPSVVLTSGVSFSIFSTFNKDCVENFSQTGHDCTLIEVDIDGPKKGKSMWGVDIFRFAVTKTGIIPMAIDSSILHKVCRVESVGDWCSGWIIKTGNMDYLNADSTGKCNNSDKTLSTTVTSCK